MAASSVSAFPINNSIYEIGTNDTGRLTPRIHSWSVSSPQVLSPEVTCTPFFSPRSSLSQPPTKSDIKMDETLDDVVARVETQNYYVVIAVIANAISTICLLLHRIHEDRQKYAPQCNIQPDTYLYRLYNGRDSDCVDMVRMRRAPFFKLCDIMCSRGLLVDTLNVKIEEQVAMLLHTLGHSVRNRVIRFNFERSGETVSRYFRAALHAVGELRHEFIMPQLPETPYKIKSSTRFMPFFQDCIGAIDGTHIKARVPKANEAAFRGRKPYPTQNVLAAVDFDLRFTYVLAGWEGSAHDAAVLKNALERSDGLRVPTGKYYLADGGYSTRSGFISPYRATRYHLKEFSSISPTNYKELFNLRHSSLCTTVQRAFGSLKNRFTIIKSEPYFPLQTQVDIVLACCILHNWIVTEGGDEFIQTEDEWAMRTQYRIGDQATVDDSGEWVDRRDEIAHIMWTRIQNDGY